MLFLCLLHSYFQFIEFIERIVINERINPITIGEGASFGVVISYFFLPTQKQVFKKLLLIFLYQYALVP